MTSEADELTIALVLVAALIGTLLLRESFGLRRILASAALVVGIVLVQIEFG